MAWIELHQTLPRHPKLIRLANRLRVPRAQVAGHLTFLWLWTLDYAPSGDLSAFGPAEISAAADFGGDAELFAKALIETGWLDEGLQVHDWHEYAGRLIDDRVKAKERMREFRQRQREENERKRSDALRERSRTFAERSELPNPTQPNQERGGGEEARARGVPVTSGSTPTEPPAGFPKTEEQAREQAGVHGVLPDLAARAWTLAASRGWRDSKDVPIRSWPHYVAHCQARDRDRQAADVVRAAHGAPRGRGRPESKQIKENLPLPILA